MTKRLEGKVAIVTGAGSIAAGVGNGKATAIKFAREGARVMLVDKNLSAAQETEEIIKQEGGESFTYAADVSVSRSCHDIASECLSRWGRIDVLHNNVGIELPGGLEETSEAEWDKTMDVNLKGMFFMCQAVIGQMKQQQSGSIVNISSINAIRALPAFSLAYSVSKAGVIALSRDVAVEYAPYGIRVNAILPGMMATPFVESSLTQAYGGNIDAMMARRDSICPTGKQGRSEDVANLAAFLASDEAQYITGEALVVDGAQTCRI